MIRVQHALRSHDHCDEELPLEEEEGTFAPAGAHCDELTAGGGCRGQEKEGDERNGDDGAGGRVRGSESAEMAAEAEDRRVVRGEEEAEEEEKTTRASMRTCTSASTSTYVETDSGAEELGRRDRARGVKVMKQTTLSFAPPSSASVVSSRRHPNPNPISNR